MSTAPTGRKGKHRKERDEVWELVVYLIFPLCTLLVIYVGYLIWGEISG